MTEAVSRRHSMIKVRHMGAARQSGVAMMESLMAMTILLVGLLGVAGLQAKTHTANFEAYQRAQAMLLLDDMVNRIRSNRYAAACYAVTGAAGTPYLGSLGPDHRGNTDCTAVVGTVQTRAIAERGMADWNVLLQGATENEGGNNRGAMIGARGCVTYDAVTDRFTVTVAWQGIVPTFAPAVNCANGHYGPETQRRVVTTTFRIASLAN